MTPKTRIIATLLGMILVIAAFTPTVLADTDGNEIKISDEPDKLILQLGPEWIGVEFELKTDAGIFPVPVVVDSGGILKMDLGGSKTYTLSCLSSSVAVPVPAPEQSVNPETEPPESKNPDADGEADTPQSGAEGIPMGVLVIFIGGLAAAVAGLVIMRYLKHRRDSYVYDDDEDDYE